MIIHVNLIFCQCLLTYEWGYALFQGCQELRVKSAATRRDCMPGECTRACTRKHRSVILVRDLYSPTTADINSVPNPREILISRNLRNIHENLLFPWLVPSISHQEAVQYPWNARGCD